MLQDFRFPRSQRRISKTIEPNSLTCCHVSKIGELVMIKTVNPQSHKRIQSPATVQGERPRAQATRLVAQSPMRQQPSLR